MRHEIWRHRAIAFMDSNQGKLVFGHHASLLRDTLVVHLHSRWTRLKNIPSRACLDSSVLCLLIARLCALRHLLLQVSSQERQRRHHIWPLDPQPAGVAINQRPAECDGAQKQMVCTHPETRLCHHVGYRKRAQHQLPCCRDAQCYCVCQFVVCM